jgi:hypothetical protein
LFRKWKSELNTNYVKKGLVPKYMGKGSVERICSTED